MSKWLMHYGIIGMKWGVRRFQNEDGTLTDLGKKRYEKNLDKYVGDDGQLNERGQKKYDRLVKKANRYYDAAEKQIQTDVSGRYGDRSSLYVQTGNKYQVKAQMLKDNPELLERAMKLGEKYTTISEKEKITRVAVAAGMTAVSVALMATGALPFAMIFSPNPNQYKYADSEQIAKEAQAASEEKRRLREEERLRKKQGA